MLYSYNVILYIYLRQTNIKQIKNMNKLRSLGMLFVSINILISCGEDTNKSQYNKKQMGTEDIDICRCLTEPGNSEWAISNRTKCDKEINNRLGVNRWLASGWNNVFTITLVPKR